MDAKLIYNYSISLSINDMSLFLEVAALKQELHKTKAALDISNGKLRLKEELAITAIAAQEAAERSLRLADTRAVELRRQVEELTRQLEEAEKHEHNSHKVRRICWPWQVFKLSSGNIASKSWKCQKDATRNASLNLMN